METFTELMRKVDSKLRWGCGLWFHSVVLDELGSWLGINALKIGRTGEFLRIGFLGLLLLAFFVAECTQAILAAIDENKQDSQS